ncbi:MAG: preprotein translocase subunit SecE [Deltaproteobacteria bacterium HGW-Deltaproteobacteria-17]|nr:MAG: preprotein translocase subunit SecE [Deltaproteobacteria bacterium HGW-Deltaproteobacteria-17]
MGDRKYIHLVFLVLVLLASWVSIKSIDLVWSMFARPDKLWPELLGIGLGLLVVGFYWLKQETFDWVGAIIHELKRVTWPTKTETSSATVVVVITVIIAAILMGMFDWFWALVTDYILLT